MRREVGIVVLSVLMTGCAHVPVVTLESAIRDTAQAVQRAVGPASDTVKVEIAVVTATEAGATPAIPVVPISLKRTRTQTTKLTVDVDLKKFKPPSRISAEPSRYMLNVKTGALDPVPEEEDTKEP